ncbi:hypothetical protein T484DRAFT_1866615, partial [Baffinella frigidus]
GDEVEITHCPSSGWGRNNCNHNEDVGVCCIGPSLSGFQRSNNPLEMLSPDGKRWVTDRQALAGNNGIIRLAGCRPQGCRLEVNINDAWGTVCDDHFNDVDAGV